jgi:hypothetical protein
LIEINAVRPFTDQSCVTALTPPEKIMNLASLCPREVVGIARKAGDRKVIARPRAMRVVDPASGTLALQ